MRNVVMTLEGTRLIIVVDLGQTLGPSKSGKTLIIASTDGNVQTPDGAAIIGLNVYKATGK